MKWLDFNFFIDVKIWTLYFWNLSFFMFYKSMFSFYLIVCVDSVELWNGKFWIAIHEVEDMYKH